MIRVDAATSALTLSLSHFLSSTWTCHIYLKHGLRKMITKKIDRISTLEAQQRAIMSAVPPDSF